MQAKDILVVNPGSTSTKIAVFTGDAEQVVFEKNIVHDEQKILEFPTVASQEEYRKEMILNLLEKNDYSLDNLGAVVGRGGMLFGLEGGGYKVNKLMYEKMADPELPQHASSLGALLAYSIAEPLGLPSFIYDSTMGCDLMDVAKVTGIAEIEKYGAVHLLNSRAQAIRYAEQVGEDYKNLNFIICHMGGGITCSAMKGGKVIDTAAYDDGPMAAERSGGVPLLLFIQLCFDGKHTEEDMKKLVAGKGGLYSYLGTKDCFEIENNVLAGDEKSILAYKAMGFQAAKSIAGLSCALEGKVDAIILTGGLARSKPLVDWIKQYCGHIGNVVLMPGEKEMEALASGTARMLAGEEEIKELGKGAKEPKKSRLFGRQ